MTSTLTDQLAELDGGYHFALGLLAAHTLETAGLPIPATAALTITLEEADDTPDGHRAPVAVEITAHNDGEHPSITLDRFDDPDGHFALIVPILDRLVAHGVTELIAY